MLQPPPYYIKSKIWLWQAQKGSWHFATVPKEVAEDIRKMFGYLAAGWGSIPVELTIGQSTWKTSIFPDKKSGTYIIPLKSDIRKKENLKEGDEVEIDILVRV